MAHSKSFLTVLSLLFVFSAYANVPLERQTADTIKQVDTLSFPEAQRLMITKYTAKLENQMQVLNLSIKEARELGISEEYYRIMTAMINDMNMRLLRKQDHLKPAKTVK